MPMYEYFCEACQEIIESIEKQEIKEIKCLTCGKRSGRVFPTSMHFKLKGSGWFKDGYSTKKKGK